MTRRTSTKRTLTSSVIALVLCVAMLIGTTFAWFTDSVTSGKNQIIAGNLDIELEYSKDCVNWNTVKDATDLFTNNLWEPGHAEVVYLRVVNKGTLALKYKLGVNIVSETGSINKDGDPFQLSEHIEYGVVEDQSTVFANREAAVAAVEGKSTKLAERYLTDYVKMEANENAKDYVAMVVYMPTTVGNEANYMTGAEAPTIELGVNVVATQVESEYDSFGNDYDAKAEYADKVYTATKANFASIWEEIDKAEDKIVMINLTEDVAWTTGASHGSTPFVSSEAAVEKVIINGNGHTLTATGSGVGPIRLGNGGAVVVNDLNVVDESKSYAEDSWEFTYLEMAGNITYNNCTFNSGIMVGSDDYDADSTMVFNSCSFKSEAASEYSVWVNDGNATFKNCAFTGTRALKMHEDYGSEIGTVIVNGCTFDEIEKKPGIVIGTLNENTVVSVTNNLFANCQAGDQGKYIYETDTDVTTFEFVEKDNKVENYTAKREIGTVDELKAFAEEVNGGKGLAGTKVVLTADIDLDGAEWTPIGQTGTSYGATNYFQGTFDGQGYTISNFKIKKTNDGEHYAAGLFGFIDAADAVIKNLNVDNATVKGHHWTGVIAGYITGTITNCKVTNSSVECTHANSEACGDKAGVITGYVNSGTVTGNIVENCTVAAGRDGGQVAGAAKTTQVFGNTIKNVTVTATDGCTGANINNAEIGRIM